MATFYLGGAFVSHEHPRFSHLSAQAQEAAYFEQFKPENMREFHPLPLSTIFVVLSIGLVALGSFLCDGVIEPKLDASSREVARTQTIPPPGSLKGADETDYIEIRTLAR